MLGKMCAPNLGLLIKIDASVEMTMGSQHRQVAILVPDDKLDCFDVLTKKIGLGPNSPAFYPGPVLPPRADCSPLVERPVQIV